MLFKEILSLLSEFEVGDLDFSMKMMMFAVGPLTTFCVARL